MIVSNKETALSRRDRIALALVSMFLSTDEYSDLDAIRQAVWFTDVLIMELNNAT